MFEPTKSYQRDPQFILSAITNGELHRQLYTQHYSLYPAESAIALFHRVQLALNAFGFGCAMLWVHDTKDPHVKTAYQSALELFIQSLGHRHGHTTIASVAPWKADQYKIRTMLTELYGYDLDLIQYGEPASEHPEYSISDDPIRFSELAFAVISTRIDNFQEIFETHVANQLTTVIFPAFAQDFDQYVTGLIPYGFNNLNQSEFAYSLSLEQQAIRVFDVALFLTSYYEKISATLETGRL